MKRSIFVLIFLLFGFSAFTQSVKTQPTKTENVILVTLDGFRWQEVFTGADSAILFNEAYVKDREVINAFWHPDSNVRRQKLLPFLWEEIGAHGQLYGNRAYKNFMDCTNLHWFSYPGYSELFSGFVDRRIRSNDHGENPNFTILDFISWQKGYEGKVAAFGTWEAFSDILREDAGDVVVNAGKEPARGTVSEREQLLNELQESIPDLNGDRYDAFTFYYAFEYLKREKPHVLFIGLGETDHYGHVGQYDEYLTSAHRTDRMLASLWEWVQSNEEYRDKTTLIITTDHGRGKGYRKSWKRHGRLFFGSGQIWMAAIGPDTPAIGEMKSQDKLCLDQIASTIGALLGFVYTNVEEVGEVIQSVVQPAALAARENSK